MMIVLTWKNDWDINLQKCAKLRENCNLVSIDCYSVWFGFVFGCADKFDPVAG
jgi:hypothetical protein